MLVYLSLQTHKSTLVVDEITTVKKNLQTSGVNVDMDFVSVPWRLTLTPVRFGEKASPKMGV